MKKLLVLLFAVAVLVCVACTGFVACNHDDADVLDINKNLDLNTPVALKIISNKSTWPALENVITKFETKYPNCTVTYECVQGYFDVLNTRLAGSEDKVDMFMCENIQATTAYKDKAFNLLSRTDVLDLSQTNKGLVDNFKYLGTEDQQYSIPYSGEMRGMYVNKTLLSQYGLSVPTNLDELLHCCEVLLQAGYIPLQSSPGSFAQQLLYPYICNQIVNGGDYESTYAAIENIEDDISENFREPYRILYNIVKKGYYNYKEVETNRGLSYGNDLEKAQVFFNVLKDENGALVKQDDVGQIAFMPDTQGFQISLEKVKSDYHSNIDYEFILSPVGEDGGYAYLSPSNGLAINKNSDNLEWSLEFFDFFFKAENNKEFAKIQGTIPNTSDALISYNVSNDRISTVGQVTFSYAFYKAVTTPMTGGYSDMVGISKMNASKYMVDDGNGGTKFAFTLNQYMDRLEAEFQKIKQARQA